MKTPVVTDFKKSDRYSREGGNPNAINPIIAAGLTIDPQIKCVYAKQKLIRLTKTELSLLLIFVRNLDSVITIEMLNMALNSKNESPTSIQPAVVHHIRRLKRKFLEAGLYCGPKHVHKQGYIWNPLLG